MEQFVNEQAAKIAQAADQVAQDINLAYTTLRIVVAEGLFHPLIQFFDIENNLVCLLWREKDKWYTMQDKQQLITMYMSFSQFLIAKDITPTYYVCTKT